MEPTLLYAVTQRDLDALVQRIRDEVREVVSVKPEPLVKVSVAAKQLGMSEKTVRRRVKSRQWPSYQDGDGVTVLLDVQEIRALLRVEAERPTTHI